ncbi:chalcone isomerase family protein [Aquimarina sp. U1-2]|uniref:chalcone isomerase family protein n=1 Tax=Aquimarina sp. U1-2 TaxID=2823141 RepID=UPI001AECAE7A|nr:chalcone isomerase family protein [Aquimarina sp. U1-2]MBP2833719.1 chalcone isomerase family protein [Aquimarina sp. U1-2]
MKNLTYCLTFFMTYVVIAQTQVGDVRFNDVDTFGELELILNGAGEDEDSYALASYFGLDFDVEDLENGNKVAEKDDHMALTMKMTSSMSQEKFTQMMRNGFERATDGNSFMYEDKIRQFLGFFPNKINKYDIYKMLYEKGGKISVYKNKEILGTLNDIEFKKALFKIWLGSNPLHQGLKEDLLASVDTNLVLGKWKTYDKETGVAINIIQMYMLKDKVFGSIVEMLRISEKDDVCFQCQGKDKNQKVEGLVILKNLKPKGEHEFGDGKFTNIRDGQVSDCQIWIDEDNRDILNVKYKGGGTHQWKRVKE